MHKTDTAKLVKYSDSGFSKNMFYDKGNLKAQVICLKEGQIIPQSFNLASI